MRRNTSILFFIIAAVLLISGCFSKNNGNTKKNKEKDPIIFNLGSDYKTLDPHLFSEMIAAQVDSLKKREISLHLKSGKMQNGVMEAKLLQMIFYLPSREF